MWRINGLSTSYLLVLVCALLLTNGVKCQEDPTDAPTTPPADAGAGAGAGATPGPTADAGSPDATAADNPLTGTPGDGSAPFTVIQVTDTPAVEAAAAEDAPAPVTPDVKCVGKEDISESKAVKASVSTSDCVATKDILESAPVSWCSEACKINLYQEGSTVLLESEDASSGTLASALQSEELKKNLGVKDVKYTSSSSSVLAGILVTGLLAAVALTVGYFKCQRRPSPKGERLAEEGTPVDQQNQANTLASDAPLNPPPETPEKPSANGEAPEGDKTQPPPTNGHSTPANTADTEL